MSNQTLRLSCFLLVLCMIAQANVSTSATPMFSKRVGVDRLEMREGWSRTFVTQYGRTIPVDHPKFTLFLISSDGSERAVWEGHGSGFHGWKGARELNRVQMLDAVVEADAVIVVFNQDGACWAYVKRPGADGQPLIEPFHDDFKRVPVKYGASFSRVPTLGVAARSASIKGSLRDANLSVDLVDSDGMPLKFILRKIDGQARWERVDQNAT